MDYKSEQQYYFFETARRALDKPYIWGGDDPTGFDCSGLVVECLKTIGLLSEKEDLTADGLWRKYHKNFEVTHPEQCSLAFWWNGGKMTHVAICVSEHFCITADGGGSTTLTVEDAIEQNAFVKIRPIDHRKNKPVFINLFK